MRVVICSDVHGNVAALEAVLADIRREGWPDVFFVAGDLALSVKRQNRAGQPQVQVGDTVALGWRAEDGSLV